MDEPKSPNRKEVDRLKPLKMPLPMEDALRGAMQVPPPKDKAEPKSEAEPTGDMEEDEPEPKAPEKPKGPF